MNTSNWDVTELIKLGNFYICYSFLIAHSYEDILTVTGNLRLTRRGSSYHTIVFQDRKSSGTKLIAQLLNGTTLDPMYALTLDTEMLLVEARTYYTSSTTRLTLGGYDSTHFYITMVSNILLLLFYKIDEVFYCVAASLAPKILIIK